MNKRMSKWLSIFMAVVMVLGTVIHIAPMKVFASIDSNEVQQISPGGMHTLMLKKDGTVWAWGWNYSGQLGDGTFNNSVVPVRVTGLENVQYIYAGMSESWAVKADGSVWAWGYNSNGRLGLDVAIKNTPVPVQLQGVSQIKQIVSNDIFALALKQDGTLWGWGNNYNKILLQETASTTTPIQVPGITDVKTIAIGGSSSQSSCYIIKQDDSLWYWGKETKGSFGGGESTNSTQLTPIKMDGISNVKDIYAGSSFVLILKNDGSIWMTGTLSANQTSEDLFYGKATEIKELAGSKAIGGGRNPVVLKNDGTLWSWGISVGGQIGNRNATNTIFYKTLFKLSNLENVVSFSGRGSFFAIEQDGSIWGWGGNSYNNITDQITGDVLEPIKISEDNGRLATPSKIASKIDIVYTWNTVSGASDYIVELNGKIIDTVNKNTITVKDLDANQTYIFRVKATNGTMESDWSQPYTVTSEAK